MIEPIKRIGIIPTQKKFILKAISNLSVLYEWDISEEEFKESYEVSKGELIVAIDKLKKVLI